MFVFAMFGVAFKLTFKRFITNPGGPDVWCKLPRILDKTNSMNKTNELETCCVRDKLNMK